LLKTRKLRDPLHGPLPSSTYMYLERELVYVLARVIARTTSWNVPGVRTQERQTSGFVQQGGLVSAYAALRPRDKFYHPHQQHMKDT